MVSKPLVKSSIQAAETLNLSILINKLSIILYKAVSVEVHLRYVNCISDNSLLLSRNNKYLAYKRNNKKNCSSHWKKKVIIRALMFCYICANRTKEYIKGFGTYVTSPRSMLMPWSHCPIFSSRPTFLSRFPDNRAV